MLHTVTTKLQEEEEEQEEEETHLTTTLCLFLLFNICDLTLDEIGLEDET